MLAARVLLPVGGLAKHAVVSAEKIRDRNEAESDALVRLGFAWDGMSSVAGDETKLGQEKAAIRYAFLKTDLKKKVADVRTET